MLPSGSHQGPRLHKTRSGQHPNTDTTSLWVRRHGRRERLPPGAGRQLSLSAFLRLELPTAPPRGKTSLPKNRHVLGPHNRARCALRAAIKAARRERMISARSALANAFPVTKAEYLWISHQLQCGAPRSDVCEFLSV